MPGGEGKKGNFLDKKNQLLETVGKLVGGRVNKGKEK